jgi:putative flippase GtrA
MNTFLKLYKGNNDNVLVQLFRYTWVGGLAFIVDYLSLYLLTEYAEVYYLLSAGIAFVLGLTVNYVLSTLWVFSNSRLSNKLSEFVVFTIIGIIGLGLNEVIMYICCKSFNIHYLISKLFSTVVVFLWNFFGRKYILFTNKKNG